MKVRINKASLTIVSFAVVFFQITVLIFISITGRRELYFIPLINAIAILSIYSVLIFTNRNLKGRGKFLWIFFILFFHIFTVPIYWSCFIRTNQQFENSVWIMKQEWGVRLDMVVRCQGALLVDLICILRPSHYKQIYFKLIYFFVYNHGSFTVFFVLPIMVLARVVLPTCLGPSNAIDGNAAISLRMLSSIFLVNITVQI